MANYFATTNYAVCVPQKRGFFPPPFLVLSKKHGFFSSIKLRTVSPQDGATWFGRTMGMSLAPLARYNTITAATVIDADGFSERDGHTLLRHQSCSAPVFCLRVSSSSEAANWLEAVLLRCSDDRNGASDKGKSTVSRQKIEKNSLGPRTHFCNRYFPFWKVASDCSRCPGGFGSKDQGPD